MLHFAMHNFLHFTFVGHHLILCIIFACCLSWHWVYDNDITHCVGWISSS
jgi:hypothetical protein